MRVFMLLVLSYVVVSMTGPNESVAAGFNSVPHAHVARTRESMRSLRYHGVLGQHDWYTCGAAAVGTWLTYYFNRPTTEEEVLEVAVSYMLERGQDPMQGLSLMSLREALAFFGVTSFGYRVDVDGLQNYFDAGGLPVLLHVTRPELHYVLAVGAHNGHVFLADPSYGRLSLSFDALVTQKGFEGVVLVASVDQKASQWASKNQKAHVASFVRRHEQLRHLKGMMAP